MEAFGLYLLKSVIWLSGFAIVFILFLRNERFFFLNRIYLLAGIFTSLFFPLISIHYIVELPVTMSIPTGGITASPVTEVNSISVKDPGLVMPSIYCSGVLIVALWLLKQSKSVFKVINNSEVTRIHSVKLIRTARYATSFSFFSYVFVNPSITDIETREIVNHEMAHIRQKHWFDLVLVELLCIIQWFNPLVWVYVRFIRQNHEYLADEVALQRTSDPAIYKATLLNQIVGSPVVNLANSFNYSINKKRFNMMKNIISSPYKRMKILFILPVFAIILYSFAKPEYRYSVPDGSSTINAPRPDVQKSEVKGTVFQHGGKPLPGASIVLAGTTQGTSANENGYFKLSDVPGDGMIVVSYVGFKTKELKPVFNSEMKIEMVRDTIRIKSSKTGIPEAPDAPPPPPPVDREAPVMNAGTPPPPPPPLKVSNENQNENSPFVIVEAYPEFKGGNAALNEWILQNVKYPVDAAKNKVTGKVVVSFTVTGAGKVINVEVPKPVNPLLDAEAKRVISSMPDWKPALQAGKPIDVQVMVPVEFKLN